jgi:hypothetical protein
MLQLGIKLFLQMSLHFFPHYDLLKNYLKINLCQESSFPTKCFKRLREKITHIRKQPNIFIILYVPKSVILYICHKANKDFKRSLHKIINFQRFKV